MEVQKIISFIDKEREAQKIRKNALCARVDITVQYYDLLIKHKSVPNAAILERLVHELGYKLTISKEI